MQLTSPNFAFLAAHDPLLTSLAAHAERYCFDDPTTSLSKLRLFGEALAQRLAANVGEFTSTAEKQYDLLQRLEARQALDAETAQLFHSIRIVGNKASHDPKFRGTSAEALNHLRFAWQLAVWFHRVFRAGDFSPAPFATPLNPADQQRVAKKQLAETEAALAKSRAALEAAEASANAAAAEIARAKIAAEEEALARKQAEARAEKAGEERAVWEQLAQEAETRLAQELAAVQAAVLAAPPQALEHTLARAKSASAKIQLSEAETRQLIDEQLRGAGWEADSAALTHALGARPVKDRNQAIAEWPTDTGPADYALFVGLMCVAVIEAKAKHRDVSAAIEQAKRYSQGMKARDGAVLGGPWEKHRVPFLYATNGRPYLRQLESKSGIHFLDARLPTNHSRALEAWHSPEGLAWLYGQDIESAEAKLAAEPTDYLGLRDYQINAIRAVEKALQAGQKRALVAMATGTGKTRTFVGLIYRLIKANRFHRVLFLVDRTALGEQAAGAFTEARIENLQTFAQIFEVKELKHLQPDATTRLQFATAQAMIQRILLGKPEDVPPIDQYDCIVVDECHRGYALDREMSDAELGFRDEADYISKYRRVLDHFDAVKIGLTATPALHTTQIFGDPVYQYSYREAVIDGWLVDQEPPIRIETKLAREGIRYAVGEPVQAYNPVNQQLDLIHMPDEIVFDVEQFNRQVITENFNRVVCTQLAKEIDPTLESKTLVFCATDAHADMVVQLLKEAFDAQYGPVDDDAVVKITGTSDKPGQLIRRYRNERTPSVAVTVDLLTTGIDIPKISNLVFLRRVKSRILYEQMKGRATRLCPEIGKTAFRVFDAVDLYEALEGVTAMKPVVVRPQIAFEQLVRELVDVADESARQEVLEQLVAKLQRKATTLQRDVASAERFEEAAGMPAKALATQLRQQSPAEAAAWFATHPTVVSRLDERGDFVAPVVISQHEDELLGVERGYKNGDGPQDYLESFGAFLKGNLNTIPALMVVTQRPRDLTRAQLKELKLALDAAGYTEASLQVAWLQVTNQDIAASIIGFVRQKALGSPLVPYSERVERAMKRVLGSRAWSEPQRKWLERIAAQLKEEKVVDPAALDRGEFKAGGGGFARIDKVFGGRLAEVLGDISDALWQDVG